MPSPKRATRLPILAWFLRTRCVLHTPEETDGILPGQLARAGTDFSQLEFLVDSRKNVHFSRRKIAFPCPSVVYRLWVADAEQIFFNMVADVF